ncbi:MAG: hypothetical protein ACRDGT_09230 [Candidatus Limnocylindria bacterium]
MSGLKRTLASLAVACGLAVAMPIAALADPIDVDVTVDDPAVSDSSINIGSTSASVSVDDTTVDATSSGTTLTTSGTTVTTTDATATVTTTGTAVGASVPGTTATVLGNVGQPGSPSVTVTPGSGAVSSDTTATRSGSGLTRDGTIAVGDSALLLATEITSLDQAALVTAGASEPITGTTVDVQAQAQAILCLLATASVDPTKALLDTTCASPSTVDGATTLGVTNTLTGTTLSSGAVLRAAICLIATAASPLPSGTGSDDALVLAEASLTTLCDASPSTASGDGDLTLTNEATGTTISTAAAIDAAICLLANGVIGDPTTLQLATTCGLADDAAPTTSGATAPTTATNETTGTTASLEPALEAAICVLANAMAQLPEGDEAAVTADILTACGTEPSTGSATTPTMVDSDLTGTDADLTPAVDAAICILATARAGIGNVTADVTDACAAAMGTPDDGTADGDETSRTDGGAPSAPSEGQAPSEPGDQGTGAVTAPSEAAAPAAAPSTQLGGEQLPGSLPSTSTAVAGLAVLTLATLAFLATARRSRRR